MRKHRNIANAFILHYKIIRMYKSSNGREMKQEFSETRKMNCNYNSKILLKPHVFIIS